MKANLLLISVFAFSAVAFLNGCGPTLAQSPMGEKEMEWEVYLKETYSEWQPPQTLPPTTYEKSASDSEQVLDGPFVIKEEVIAVEEPAKVTGVNGNYEMYIVQKGDSLWKIAKKFYQSGSKWRRVQEANMDALSNPKALKPGMELRIPLP